MPTSDELKLTRLDKQIAELQKKIDDAAAGGGGLAVRTVLDKFQREMEQLQIDRQQLAETIGETGKLAKTQADIDERVAAQDEILARIQKEGILGAEGLQKILAARAEEVEFARGARNRQLARSAQAFRQRAGGRLGPRSGAAENVVFNQALAPAVGGIVQQGAQNAAFRGELERANELSKTLQPLEGLRFISGFLQNQFGQQSTRDLNLRGLAQGESQFRRTLEFQREQANRSRGFQPTDLFDFVPFAGDVFDLFDEPERPRV